MELRIGMGKTTKPRANNLEILSGRLIRFTERKGGATRTKHSLLVLFSPLVAFGDTVKDREGAVRSDRKKMTGQKKGCNRFSEASTLAKAFKPSIGKMKSRAVPIDSIGGKAEFTVAPDCHTGR